MSDAIYWPCADVLILASELSAATNLPSPSELRQRLVDMLDRMVHGARAAGASDADISEARYALVAYIDEQILKSTWPGRSEWMSQPLQLVLYREFTAGENFFTRMRSLLNQGGRDAALQIYYLCLALGFNGVYGTNAKQGDLTSFSDDSAKQVMRGLPSPSKISPHAHPRDRMRANKSGLGPLVGIIAGSVIVVVAVIGGLQWSLRSTLAEAEKAIPAVPSTTTR